MSVEFSHFPRINNGPKITCESIEEGPLSMFKYFRPEPYSKKTHLDSRRVNVKD